MRMYTGRGDTGSTDLLGERTVKDDPRIEALGALDEADSAMGLGRALASDERVQEAVLAAQRDFAATWFVSSCDYAEQGGFSGAVRPDKAADLLFRNIKAHVLQGGYAPKVLGQALYLQNRHVFS